MALPLSILDFDQKFLYAPEIGPYAEALGYRRYWFAEHDPQPNVEMFVGLLAGMTTTLRIGSGGVLLRFRDVPQSIVNFRFLVDAFHGRIDAGFCGGGPMPLRDSNEAKLAHDEFKERAARWVQGLRERDDGDVPEIWSLGTGRGSADNAATLGLAYAYSLFHVPSEDPFFMDHYRESFQPSSSRAVPHTMIAYAGLCARSAAEAELHIAAHRNTAIRVNVWGDPDRCAERLRVLVDRFRPDELMVLDLSKTLAHKKESIRLWSEIAAAL